MAERPRQNQLVGRTEELATLQVALETARSGEMSTVIIGGEAGVGKSRLVRRFLEDDKGVATTVLTGGCNEYGDTSLPFGPIVEALRPLGRRLDDKTRAELLEPVTFELSKGSDSGKSRSQVFEMLLALVEAISERGPLVLVLDDLHWADRSTLDAVAFLVSTLRTDARVFLVLMYRSDELASGHWFLRYAAQLARNEGVSRLFLERLDKNELLTHLDQINGAPVDPSVAEAVFNRSQGNPFYAEELLISASSSSHGVPVNVRDALGSRVRALSDGAQQVVGTVAAAGDSVAHSVLRAVSGSQACDDAIHEAVDAQVLVVRDDETLAFRHVLLQEVAYESLLPQERQAIHERYAVVLATDPMNISDALIAWHQFAAGKTLEGFRSSLAAAEHAAATHGYAESHAHYERALQAWEQVLPDNRPIDVDHVDLLDRCASVSHLEGDNHRSAQLMRYAVAEVATDDPRAQLLHVRLGTYLGAIGESQEALVEHESVVRQIDEALSSSTNAAILCAYSQSLMNAARHRESMLHAEVALKHARTVGDQGNEARALSLLGSNLVVLGQPENGAERLGEALDLAEVVGRPGEIAESYRHLARTLSGPLNRLQEALDVATRGYARVVELGLERHYGVSMQSIAIDTLFRMGRWNEALAMLSVATRRLPKGAAALDLLLARAKLTVGTGQYVEAEADLNSVTDLARRAIDLRYNVPLATLRAGLALWRHDLNAASLAVASGFEHIGESEDVWFAAPLVWHGMRVEAERSEQARAHFDDKAARKAVARGEELRSLSKTMCNSGRQQGALRLVVDAYDIMCEGERLRINGESAPEVWSVVAAAWDELAHPYPAAYARWRWAEAALSRPNGVARASQLLREAHEVAVELGAAPLQQELEDLAQRARIDLMVVDTVRPESVVDVRETALDRMAKDAGLTKREVQIFELVAEGQSNRSIAESCFISEKTASVHVSNIMTKLGVRSRVQAAALLHKAVAATDQ